MVANIAIFFYLLFDKRMAELDNLLTGIGMATKISICRAYFSRVLGSLSTSNTDN